MNFHGLTKEAKVELSHILYMISIVPKFEKQKELLEMVRNAVNSEIRTHLTQDSSKAENMDDSK